MILSSVPAPYPFVDKGRVRIVRMIRTNIETEFKCRLSAWMTPGGSTINYQLGYELESGATQWVPSLSGNRVQVDTVEPGMSFTDTIRADWGITGPITVSEI